MKLKNYQEDLVLNTIRLVIEDRPEVLPDDSFVHDVAAYTLNRLAPKYIMSERGFTRIAPAYWLEGSDESAFADMVELVLLVNRAIDIVQSRRHTREQSGNDKVETGELFAESEVGFWHNYPHLIGRVWDKESSEPISGVCITLYLNGELSQPAESGWDNPYYTNPKNNGFFSFWPRPEKMRAESKEILVEVAFEHSEYVSFRHHQKTLTKGEYELADYIKPEEILNLGSIQV